MSEKISISVPASVLEEVERERRSRGESRSEFFRRAVEEYMRREKERGAIARYLRGYLEHPDTEEERVWAEGASAPALAESPWKDGRA
jgi:metal-responsive CopG/Arc/MetJ family transcriptional regulator